MGGQRDQTLTDQLAGERDQPTVQRDRIPIGEPRVLPDQTSAQTTAGDQRVQPKKGYRFAFRSLVLIIIIIMYH